MDGQSSYEDALLALESATFREAQKLMKSGMSRVAAAHELQSRLEAGDSSLAVVPTEAVEAANLANRMGITAENALSTLCVRRQMRILRDSGIDLSTAVSILTDRVELKASERSVSVAASAAHRHSASTPPPSSATPSFSQAPVLAAAPVNKTASLTNNQRPRGPSAVGGGSKMASAACSDGSGESRATGSLKRSRSVEQPRPAASSRDAEHEAEKERELARQIAGLTGEINDAMRAGDRGKVARLMRQRDQLRAGASTESGDGGKRPRPGTRVS